MLRADLLFLMTCSVLLAVGTIAPCFAFHSISTRTSRILARTNPLQMAGLFGEQDLMGRTDEADAESSVVSMGRQQNRACGRFFSCWLI